MTGYIIVIVVLSLIIIILLGVIYRLWRQTQRAALGLDEISEDTLKELYHLSRQKPLVYSQELIRAANIQPARYPIIEADLAKRGWAQVEAGALRILPAGEKRAIELIRAHRLWERYLVDKEGLPLDQLHEEATRREHFVTPEQVDILEAQLGFPKYDPHGDPIPERDGELSQHAEGVSLLHWPEHQIGRVSHIEDEPPALFSQLVLLGLSPGAQVEVDERTPGRVLVWSGKQRMAVAPAVADLVYVVEAPPERIPLSEIDIGQAARVAAFEAAGLTREQLPALGLKIGGEIAAIRADPLGDPITYQVDGNEIALTRLQANQITVEAASLHEIVLPRRPWWPEQVERIRESYNRYGKWAIIKRAMMFFGPAFVISVEYMDPGNWGTDIEGGARFGYQLLWVILMANLMAILLQMLSAKLGIATGKSLPEVSRDRYSPRATIILWFTAELAAIATDLAEFLGAAVGFNLLFGIPLFPAAILTGVVISLILLLERYGFRKVELVIIGMIAIIGFVYMIEIILANPDWSAIMQGFIPSIPVGAILVIVGIIGATVMPHNLCLHSSLILLRVRPSDTMARKKRVYSMAKVDAFVALNGAFFVNAAILIMAAAVFSGENLQDYSLETAHQTLTPLLGPLAGAAFAIALLASGLSSSTTATLAGQVIMDGFMHHRMNLWLRRGITMVPSLIVIGVGVEPLKILVLSQVSLSFQLPFAMIPLIIFTSNREIMGEFVNTRGTQFLAFLTAFIILSLNTILLYQIFSGR